MVGRRRGRTERVRDLRQDPAARHRGLRLGSEFGKGYTAVPGPTPDVEGREKEPILLAPTCSAVSGPRRPASRSPAPRQIRQARPRPLSLACLCADFSVLFRLFWSTRTPTLLRPSGQGRCSVHQRAPTDLTAPDGNSRGPADLRNAPRAWLRRLRKTPNNDGFAHNAHRNADARPYSPAPSKIPHLCCAPSSPSVSPTLICQLLPLLAALAGLRPCPHLPHCDKVRSIVHAAPTNSPDDRVFAETYDQVSWSGMNSTLQELTVRHPKL